MTHPYAQSPPNVTHRHVQMGLIMLALPLAIFGLDSNLGTAKKKNATWADIFVLDNHNLNWLSLARLFLFASRDFWFEVHPHCRNDG